jgi:hypothetical protein
VFITNLGSNCMLRSAKIAAIALILAAVVSCRATNSSHWTHAAPIDQQCENSFGYCYMPGSVSFEPEWQECYNFDESMSNSTNPMGTQQRPQSGQGGVSGSSTGPAAISSGRRTDEFRRELESLQPLQIESQELVPGRVVPEDLLPEF